jgi:photosystem II cytochrome c550
MLKRFILVAVTTLFFAFQLHVSSAAAVELSQSDRTIKLNDAGDEVVLSLKQVQEGEKLFKSTCASCHTAGRTKTNPNVTLGADSLGNAEPARDNLMAMVDYLKNPTTYDGEMPILELHPNTTRTDLFPAMRNLSDDDLEKVSGYILIQPNIQGIMWGSGKAYN